SEPDITRERLALEEAIRRVETEAVRRSRGEPLPTRSESRHEQDPRTETPPDQPGVLPNPLPPYHLPGARPPVAEWTDDDGDRSDAEETRQAVPLSAAAARPTGEARQMEESRARSPRVPSSGGEAPRAEGTQWTRGAPPLSEKGLKSVRDGT